jgi:hypothetical protein
MKWYMIEIELMSVCDGSFWVPVVNFEKIGNKLWALEPQLGLELKPELTYKPFCIQVLVLYGVKYYFIIISVSRHAGNIFLNGYMQASNPYIGDHILLVVWHWFLQYLQSAHV